MGVEDFHPNKKCKLPPHVPFDNNEFDQSILVENNVVGYKVNIIEHPHWSYPYF